MKIDHINEIESEVEFTEKSKDTSKNKYKKYEILIIIGCLLLSFIIWCYANYLEDPIIRKEITVRFVLNNGEEGDAILDSTEQIVVYGEESSISGINGITVYIERSEFTAYDTPTSIEIDYPEHVHSHTTELDLVLVNSRK